MDWISFFIGFLTGIFIIIAGATFGIVRANKRLGIDLPQLATQWYKTRRLMKESGITRHLETKNPELERSPRGEEGISEVSGTGNPSNSESSISRTEEETSD